MTNEERIEAAAKAIASGSWKLLGSPEDSLAHKSRRTASIRHAEAALRAGYPEIWSEPPTAWVAPWTPDAETIEALGRLWCSIDNLAPDADASILVAMKPAKAWEPRAEMIRHICEAARKAIIMGIKP